MLGDDLDGGRYEPRREIGRGAMGIVYLAWDRRLEKEVAVKILDSGTVTDDLARATFVKEARYLGMLDQTRIARIHDFFSHHGDDVIVMEYVPGETLSDILKRGPLPEREIVRLGTQLAEGLSAAHKKGLVHRDLKPSNLRVNDDGDLKILDFGVAKLWKQDQTSPSPAPPLERIGNTIRSASGFVGTYPYLSPEQLRGSSVDARADLYAAGAVLYEMATGKQIFADTPVTDLADAIEGNRPTPARRVMPGISRSLERVIHRALEKDSAHRFEDALEMRRALLQSQWRRRSGWAGAAAALLVLATALALGAGGYRDHVFPAVQPGSVRSLAVLPFENATGDPTLDAWCAGLGRELTHAVTRAYEVAALAPRTTRQLRGHSPAVLARERGVDAVVQGRVFLRAGVLEIETEMLKPGAWRPLRRQTTSTPANEAFLATRALLESCARELGLTRRAGAQGALDRLRAVDAEALAAYNRACSALDGDSAVDLATIVELLQRAVAIDSTFAPAWAALARATYGLPTDRLPLQESVERAEYAARRAMAADADLPDPYIVLACIRAFHFDDWEGALQELDRAFALDPDHALAHRMLGIMHLRRGRFAEAAPALRRAWELDPLREPLLDPLWRMYVAGARDSVVAAGQRLLATRPDDWETYLLIGDSVDHDGGGTRDNFFAESGRQRLFWAFPKAGISGVPTPRDPPMHAPAHAPAPGVLYIADPSAADGKGAIVGLDPETGAQWIVAAGEHLTTPVDVAIDRDERLLATSQSSRRLVRIDPQTGRKDVVSAAPQFVQPCGIVVTKAGDLYVTDWNLWPPGFLYRIDRSTGAASVVDSAKAFVNPLLFACLPDGDFAVAANVTETDRGYSSGCLYRVGRVGGISVLASGGALVQPNCVRVGPDAALYVGDPSACGGNGGVIRVDPRSGAQSVVARGGDFVDPTGIAFAADGDMFVADWDYRFARGRIVRIDHATGAQERVYSGGMLARPYSLAIVPGVHAAAGRRDLVVAGPMKFSNGHFASIRVEPGAVLTVRGRLDIDGDVSIAHDARLVCDGVVAVGGDLILERGAIVSHSRGLARGSTLDVRGTIEIQATARIDATACGLRGGSAASEFLGETYDGNDRVVAQVSGGFQGGSGASHGGEGGGDSAGGVPNSPYGSATMPHHLGSGGGGPRGGAGGGRITLRARRCIVDGVVCANGAAGSVYREEIGGGGSGGSILIVAREISGTGHIVACGASGSYSYGGAGAGSGGRIALYADTNSLPGDHVTVAGGRMRAPAQPGTIHRAPWRRARTS